MAKDTPGTGHNSDNDKGISAQRLKSYIARIERLNSEREAIATDIKEVYSELKSAGFDAKVTRKVIALRKLDAAERREMEAMVDVYENAIEGIVDTPLGKAAVTTAKAAAADKVRNARTQTEAALEAIKGFSVTKSNRPSQSDADPETGEVIEETAAVPPMQFIERARIATSADDGMDIPDYLKREPAEDAPDWMRS